MASYDWEDYSREEAEAEGREEQIGDDLEREAAADRDEDDERESILLQEAA